MGTFLEGSIAALDDAFAGLNRGVRTEELACDETCRGHGSAQRGGDHFVGNDVVGFEPRGCHPGLLTAQVGQR